MIDIIVHNARHPLPEGYSAIYVGRRTSYRATLGEDFSVLGNPFPVPKFSRNEAVRFYGELLADKMADEDINEMQSAMLALGMRAAEGERLALVCWCAPARCHAECLREMLQKD